MQFLGKTIHFGDDTLKKSYADFKAEMSFIVEGLPADQREEHLLRMYREATGNEPVEEVKKKFKTFRGGTLR